MARSFTLAQLTTRCQQRADMENSSLLSTAEWQSLISSAFGRLYGELVRAGMRHFETTQTLTAASTALPAGHLSTTKVEYVADSAGSRRRLTELMDGEEICFRGQGTGQPQAYALEGSNIVLYPGPTAGMSVIHTYVPQPTDYTGSLSSVSVDVVTPDGEEFVVWAVAVKALQKEESDTAVAIHERDEALERVRRWATLRSLNTPRRRMVDGGGGWDEGDYR